MVVDDITYDIDNRDIEREMYIQDLEEEAQEEQDIAEEAEEQKEEKIQEEIEKTYYQTRRTINTKNLDLDLGIYAEQLRPVYLWESLKDGQTYEGYVIHKFDNNTYVFNASVKGANEFKLKKFTLDNIKQIKNK
jgi:hypothetical protein